MKNSKRKPSAKFYLSSILFLDIFGFGIFIAGIFQIINENTIYGQKLSVGLIFLDSFVPFISTYVLSVYIRIKYKSYFISSTDKSERKKYMIFSFIFIINFFAIIYFYIKNKNKHEVK